MKRLFAGAFILCSSLFILSCGDNSAGEKTSSDKDSKEVAQDQNEKKFDSSDLKKDAEWAVKIADGGMLEVALGKLAATNASSAKVKEFAKMMVDDHTKLNDELKTAAVQKNITLPAGMSDKCTKKYDELAAKKGADFDKAYMDAMVDGHSETLDAFKKEGDDGKDADLKKWAMDKTSTIQHHLDMAKATKDMVK